MPFIFSKVNVPISKEKEVELKMRLGKAIEILHGLTEKYLILGFEQNCHIYLRGENQPAAFIQISIFGNEIHFGYDELTAEVTKIFNDVLEIPNENIYRSDDGFILRK